MKLLFHRGLLIASCVLLPFLAFALAHQEICLKSLKDPKPLATQERTKDRDDKGNLEKSEFKKIVIFGAGYVGTVTGACLAKCGHKVTFIEPNTVKVNAINSKKCAFLEPQLESLINECIEKGTLKAKSKIDDDILEADIILIAVATPASMDGVIELGELETVLKTIQKAAEKRKEPLIAAIRSTVSPKAIRQLKETYFGEKQSNVILVVNPEFLRESTAVNDFFHPSFCVVGGDNPWAIRETLSLYKNICSKHFAVSLETACLLKYACNAFHALKISFANEMACVCEALELDPTELMNAFCEDSVLNCSKEYLKPGFAFGGSCLCKDLRTFINFGKDLNEPLPLLNSILPSNQRRFYKVLDRIVEGNHKKLAILGFTFKKNSDDIRESPFVELAKHLQDKGILLSIFDPDFQLEKKMLVNPELFSQHLSKFIPYFNKDLSFTLEECDGVVLCKDLLNANLIDQLKNANIAIYDLHYLIQPREFSK